MTESNPGSTISGVSALDTPAMGPYQVSRSTRTLLLLFFAVIGAVIAVALVPPTHTRVGPLYATIHMRPSTTSETAIVLPPAGEVIFDTHQGPVRVEARVTGLDMAAAERLINEPAQLKELEKTAPNAIIKAAVTNALITVGAAGLGSGLMVAIAFRRWRHGLISAVAAGAVVAAGAGSVAVTFDEGSLTKPHFNGLLHQAAYVADIGQNTAEDYENYRALMAEFVSQVSALYIAADQLPVGHSREDLITVLHVSDIHDNMQAYDVIERLDDQFDVDLVIDTGDIVSWGTGLENDLLKRIGTLDVPYVYISGNHDGQGAMDVIAAQPNGIVLNNEVVEVEGLVIAGVGDPRFAADDDSDGAGWDEGKAAVAASAFALADTIEQWDHDHPDNPVDLALIHDPTEPEGLLGRTPLVLSGHLHSSSVEQNREDSGTTWYTVGSTGGALAMGGVRPVLDGDKPLDLSARMMYFDRSTGEVVAYDDIVMGGLGLVSVSIERHYPEPTENSLATPEDLEEPQTPVEVPEGEPIPDSERITPQNPTQPAPSDHGGADSGDAADADASASTATITEHVYPVNPGAVAALIATPAVAASGIRRPPSLRHRSTRGRSRTTRPHVMTTRQRPSPKPRRHLPFPVGHLHQKDDQ